jgi:hypothetical protein
MTYNSFVKEFTVYKHPKKEKYEAIKIGFAWFPFLIALSCNTFLMIPLLFFFDYILIPSVLLQTVWIVGPFWLMERKLILLSLPFYLYSIHYNFVFWKDIRIELLDGRIGLPLVLALIYFLIWLLVGFKGNEWSHKKLKKKGYPIIKTIKARTRKSAIALAKNLKEDKGKEYQEVVSGNKDCPMCAETVKAKAKICRYCNYEFE